MEPIRKLAKGLSALWLLGVLVLGIGGAWLTNGGDVALFEAATGISKDEVEQQQDARQRAREKRREARALQGDGWGREAVSNRDEAGDWGAGS